MPGGGRGTPNSKGSGREAGRQDGWPHCPALDDTCLIYDVGELLGKNVRDALLSFILNAEDGARLTLQRSREGFTAQVTEAVQRSTGAPALELSEARTWSERVGKLRGKSKRVIPGQ